MYVIDHDATFALGDHKIIGPFETKDDADQWGFRNIHHGAWHSMRLTDAASVATTSSESSRGSATRA